MSPKTVTGQLSYFVPPADGSKAYFYINSDDPRANGRQRNSELSDQLVKIENLRGNESSVTLDQNGFQYFVAPATHKAFTDDEEIKREYYPEQEELIKKLTGATRVVLFDHTVRRRRPEDPDDTPEKRKPVAYVHVDQTTASAVARVHRHLPADLAPGLLERRFQIINLWRPISHPAFDWPLTLCDYRSIDTKADLVPSSLIYPDHEGETLSVKFNPGHKWKYVSGLKPEEGVLIKCFDSVQDGSVAVLTPHTAFEDPSTPEGSPLRESIELRALVFY